MSESAVILPKQELQELQNRLSREPDPVKRREIVGRVLLYVQLRWNQFFELVSNEDDPERMLLLLADLTDILEHRKANPTRGQPHRLAELSDPA